MVINLWHDKTSTIKDKHSTEHYKILTDTNNLPTDQIMNIKNNNNTSTETDILAIK